MSNLLGSLNREQKEAVGLLQVGTFLEYFDLMLYVHMAVLLNELFFPKTDPYTSSLLTAFAFCSTYVLRPLGALLFGYLGDNIGRKSTVVITTMMMAISCIVIANLPTYAQIGIASAWIITGCRIIQGLSSMGEIIGATIYLSEITKPPVRHPVVSLIAFSSALGTTASLAVASLFTSYQFNWRIAFWLGAAIAVMGSIARTRLRETSDFYEMKKRMKKQIKRNLKTNQQHKVIDPVWFIKEKKMRQKTSLACFLATSAWPVCFYFAYIHCASILKDEFGYTTTQIIHQNFLISFPSLISCFIFSILSYKIHPVKLAKARFFIFFPFILLFPFLMEKFHDPKIVLFAQIFTVSVSLSTIPAASVLVMHFPVLKRFTYSSVIYALSRAIVYVATSFGLAALTNLYGHISVLIIMIPASLSFYWGMRHFEKLEEMAGNLKSSTTTARIQFSFKEKNANINVK